jgi:hypothetical protein
MPEAGVTDINFFVQDGVPLWLLVEEGDFGARTLIFPPVLLGQGDHKISNQVVGGLINIVHITYQCFLNMETHEILSFNFKVDHLVPNWIVGGVGQH